MSNDDTQVGSRIIFDGQLTPEIRELLQAKRFELGLPFQRVAAFFGVNWSTFRKWEQGPTKSCELCFRPQLEAFLNGDYDDVLKSINRPKTAIQSLSEDMPQEVMQCLERVTNTYRLCQARPDLREKIVQSIDKATAGIIASLFSNSEALKNALDENNEKTR